jgi:hypothetical protein
MPRLIDRVRRIGKPVRAYGYGDQASWQPLPASAHGRLQRHRDRHALGRPKGTGVIEAQLDAFCNALYDYARRARRRVDLSRAGRAPLTRRKRTGCLLHGRGHAHRPEYRRSGGHAFPGRRVDDLARQAGMTPRRQGGYVMDDAADGHGLFSLVNQRGARFGRKTHASATTPSVTLLFDVPNIADGLAVFDRMTDPGLRLARSLGGHMMDDHGHPVTQASLRSDRQQLEGFYSRMRAEGIAGRQRARPAPVCLSAARERVTRRGARRELRRLIDAGQPRVLRPGRADLPGCRI